MDAYLSTEARKYLAALSHVTKECKGWLLGHIRGHRYIIEKIFTAPESSSIALEKIIELDNKLEHSLIGFFILGPDDEADGMIFSPFAVGKLFLRIKCDPDGELDILPFRVEYETDFILNPIQIVYGD